MNVRDMFDLKGKVALVTGGGRGLGKFIAMAFAEAGADVVIASRKLEKLEETAAELRETGVKVKAVKCDMAVQADIEALVDETVKEFGRVDILVNNAGLTWGAPTLDYPLEKWDSVFNVNVRGTWVLTQRVARVMKENGGGKIINISSVYGSRGSGEAEHPAVAYNSSKAAVEVLTRNLAVKLAPYNIRVNCIAPGFFRTDMMEYVFRPEMEQSLKMTLRAIPLARPGEEDDIKGLALFLASGASDYITGTVIPLDGGAQAG